MTRRGLLGLAAGGAAALAAGRRAPAVQAPAKRQPNILLVMADQHRGDCIGAAGHPCVRTPHLDRIAAEGVRFRCAYTSVPSCTPARASLLTGLSPWRHGMLGYGRVAETYENELPRMLREAGCYGLGIGKMHWSPQRALHGFHETLLDESGRAESPGFVSDYRQWFRREAPDLAPDATGIGWNAYDARPYALAERLHPTRWTGDRAVEFLKGCDRPEPWLLKVSFARPHSPYDPPERLWKMYEDANIPKAGVGAWAERHACRGQKLPADTWRGDLGAEQVRRSRQGYYGSVTFIDEQIGRILQAVQERGWTEDTLILYTADHGDMTGDHHLWRKTYAYEASARIPMLMRWPERFVSAKRGQVLAQPVELRDVLPTFLDAAGAAADPKRFDGRSLLDLVRGRAEGWREYIDMEHDVCYDKSNHWTALTDGRTKYVFHAMTGEQQLFDLEKDPGECDDLAQRPEHAAVLKLWRGRMVKHLEERGPPFVVGADLALRPERFLYSPHYPSRKA
ncbi:MAG: arylsulfatase [Planctomycetes bacterium]|nr:arylsulfatase [Planctomycetota bacterium]